jgi:hypothetical protein
LHWWDSEFVSPLSTVAGKTRLKTLGFHLHLLLLCRPLTLVGQGQAIFHVRPQFVVNNLPTQIQSALNILFVALVDFFCSLIIPVAKKQQTRDSRL